MDDVLLRTHTSNVQVRLMEHKKPPIRSIMPGRVFRNEAISARAHCIFHQVEGLYVDTDVSFKDLKDTLFHFAKEMFDKDSKIRLRPSYFPFTEPSAEIDVSCFICKGAGCNVCKYSGWVEIAGSGMVDPQRAVQLRHRPRRVHGLRLRHGHRAHRHAPLRRPETFASSRKTTCGFWGNFQEDKRRKGGGRRGGKECWRKPLGRPRPLLPPPFLPPPFLLLSLLLLKIVSPDNTASSSARPTTRVAYRGPRCRVRGERS